MMSERVDALAMVLGVKETKGKIAGCTNCEAPLICTLRFPGYEFYCIECGTKLSYVSPTPLEPTEENNARLAKLEGEWNEHADDAEWLEERAKR